MKPQRSSIQASLALRIVALLLVASPAAGQETTFPNYIPFDAAKGEAPEGAAVDQVGNVYVSFGSGSATRGAIVKFTPSGTRSVLAEFASGVAGLVVDASANVYAATGSGVFRVDRQGKTVRLPGTEHIVAANALAFDKRGNLYVTESFSFDPPFTAYPGCNPDIPAFGRGGIWRIPLGGTAALWLRDDLLSGACHIPGVPFPFGANGIAYYQDALYVVNTERGVVVRVPVLPNGDPGPIGVAAQVPEPYPTNPPVPPGADGIALDIQGNFYLAMPSHSVVVRISPDGRSWQTIATATDKLDVPASLAFGTSESARTNLFVTSLAMFPGGAGPSLVKIDTAISGLPVPPALAAPGSWTRKARMAMALDAHASCAVDGILYVIGGHKDPGVYTQLSTLFAYDPKTDSWTRKADMPTARRWPAACAVDGIIYVIGGGGMFSPDLNAVEAYDPKTDTWVPKAPLATARSGVLVGAVDGIIYAIGGVTGLIGNLQVLTKVEAYDPKTDQWTPKTRMPSGAGWGAASVVNGLIYAFFDKDTAAYDPKTDRWTRKASIPASSLRCLGTSMTAVDGMVYLFGGEISRSAGGYDLCLAYDPVQDKFTAKRKIPIKCEAAATASVDGKIYHTGGASGDPGGYPDAVYYDDLWVFDPQGGVTPQLLVLKRESSDRVQLTWQGEAGRLYGVQSTLNVARGPWTRVTFSTGTNSIMATNELVEATCTIPAADTSRFYRVLEAN